MRLPYAKYDREADAIFVYLQPPKPGCVARTKVLDELRAISYLADGTVFGVELLEVSGGIDLSDIPFRECIGRAIRDLGLAIKTFA